VTRPSGWVRDVAVLAGTALVWGVVTYAAAWSAGFDPWDTWTWGRWDSGLYLSIAESGYTFERCDGIANRGPDDWCGNSGWFPLYPYMMRVVSWTGFDLLTAGRIVAVTAMVGAWTALWFGFLRRRPLSAGALGMALAAMFPASVYYGAIFPISLMLLAVLLALACLDRQRWFLAGLCGAVATMAYTSGFVVVVIAVVPLTMASIGDLRARGRAALAVGGPIVLGYLAVLANFQRDVGAWDAALATNASYNFDPAFPLVTLWRRAQDLGNDSTPSIIAVQSLLVAAMVVTAVVVAYRHRDDLTLGERGIALFVPTMWLLPLTLGGDLSLYRAESLLLPVVVLLSRLRLALLAAFTVLSVPVSFLMAELFFNAVLI
jgi:hypothetical protein